VINYLVGDATQPTAGVGPRIICHVCNNVGAWGAGFTGVLSQRWWEPERDYRAAFASLIKPQLGQVQLVRVESGLYVANLIAQDGLPQYRRQTVLDYRALRHCMKWLAQYADSGWSFHMPRIGCGLSGGRWADVSAIVAEELGAFHVTVYDLPAGRGPN
jgi:O-acetyl-ADP-ribose deacetylase (regulator of RNase III)